MISLVSDDQRSINIEGLTHSHIDNVVEIVPDIVELAIQAGYALKRW